MRVGPMLQLMMDGSNAQLTFQAAKHRLDLRQLHVACPEHSWIFGRQIGSQQVMAIALFGSLEFGLVRLKRERLTRDGLASLRQANPHKPERPAGFFLRGSNPPYP